MQFQEKSVKYGLSDFEIQKNNEPNKIPAKIKAFSLAPMNADISPTYTYDHISSDNLGGNLNFFVNESDRGVNILNTENSPTTLNKQELKQSKIPIARFTKMIDTQIQSPVQKQTKKMSFHKLEMVTELDDIQITKKQFFPQTFHQGYNIVSRLFFYHLHKYMWKIKKEIINNGINIRQEHLPLLLEEEKIQFQFSRSYSKYQTQQKANKPLNKLNLISLIFLGNLRLKFYLALFLNVVDTLCKNTNSILMGFLIQNIFLEEVMSANMYAAIILIVNMVSIIVRHNAYYLALQYQIQVRMILINLVYQKIIQLNSFSIKEANAGKIINMVSSDLNILEHYIPSMFQVIVIPVSLVFGSYILWTRFNGPIGLLGIAFMVILYPLQIIYQRMALIYTIKLRLHGDRRLKFQNEMIEGMRLIKMFQWEKAYEKIIKGARMKEFACITAIAYITAVDRASNQIVQIWASLFFFLVLHYGGYAILTPENMIPTIYLMINLRSSCILMFTFILNGYINLKICFGRIVDILNIKNFEVVQLKASVENQIQQDCVQQTDIPILSFINFSCYRTLNMSELTQPILKNINLDIYAGELVGVIGRIGSGKSTLLSSVILEWPFYLGKYEINGETAINQVDKISFGYVEQEPYMFPDTLKKNIIFGRPFNLQLYDLILLITSLTDDINSMQWGDMTQIGDQGINLSRGQRARVSIARALYQMADVYLFDSPLTAVDAEVGQKIFNDAIKEFIFEIQPKLTGKLRKPVVLFATHLIQYASQCDHIVVLEEGQIIAKGKYEEMKQHLSMVTQDIIQETVEDTFKAKQNLSLQDVQERSMKFLNMKLIQPQQLIQQVDQEKFGLYKSEETYQNLVTLRTHIRYFLRQSPQFLIVIIFFQSLGHELIYNFYIRFLSSFNDSQRTGTKIINLIKTGTFYSFQIMGGLTALAYANNLVKYLISTRGVLGVNRGLHIGMLEQLSLTPIEFFDTNPPGRILNRFSTDLQVAVIQTNPHILDIVDLISFFMVALIFILILQPWLTLIILPTLALNVWLFVVYRSIVLQSRECDLMQRSPLFDMFRESMSGVIQLKLYKQQNMFQQHFFELSNKCIQSNQTYYYAQRSFGFNIDIVGWVATSIGIFMIIALNMQEKATLVQALLLLLIFNDQQGFCLRQIISFNAVMNSFNRMFQILDQKPEAPHHLKIDDEIKNSWPTKGQISFNNVFLRYRKDTNFVLNDMSFSIMPGEKVGCVGRTGSGKSTIVQALFRIVEIEAMKGCSITIDDQDISKLGLSFLRSSIGVIPQTPFVFSGTIRNNLDPYNKYSDESLWSALKEINLYNMIKNMPGQFDTDMTDVDKVFSKGQNQLMSLARIILNPKKIILLDEATSNVDVQTDLIIQKLIREKFSTCTIITIAHRLNTIADYDKVMVIEQGKVVEFGTPLELLSTDTSNPKINRDTTFAKLVKQNGPINSMIILQIAYQNHHSNVQRA